MRHDYDKQADRQLILGPLYKYAAIGITIGIVFITGTVTLEHKVNTFEKDVSELKAQLASENRQTKDAAKAGGQQQSSIQTKGITTKLSTQASSTTNNTVKDKALAIEDPVIGNRNIHAVDETVVPDPVQATTTFAGATETHVVADQPSVTAQEPPEDGILNNALVESPAERLIETNPAPGIEPPDSAETQELADTRVSGEEPAASPEAETFEYHEPEHLSYREWVEQQRLRHERWLDEVELRHRDEFDTRTASQPDYNVDMLDNGRERI